jgi:hypothetical protein
MQWGQVTRGEVWVSLAFQGTPDSQLRARAAPSLDNVLVTEQLIAHAHCGDLVEWTAQRAHKSVVGRDHSDEEARPNRPVHPPYVPAQPRRAVDGSCPPFANVTLSVYIFKLKIWTQLRGSFLPETWPKA